MAQNAVKAAVPARNDVSDGRQRTWFKVGRKYFGISSGYLIDVEGFVMSNIDAGFVTGFVHDKDGYRVAEALRKDLSVSAAIKTDCARMTSRAWADLVAFHKLH